MSELNRQVRALERLGEESRKALFFAASRRLMLDLMRGRTDTVAPLVALARDAADELPDGQMVVSALIAYGAVQAGDRSDARLAAARAGEALAEQEGIREVVAEIAWIYLGIGLPDDARRLASTFDQRVLSGLPRDHNYLLILQLLLDVALADRARRAGRDHHAAAAPVRRPGRDQRRWPSCSTGSRTTRWPAPATGSATPSVRRRCGRRRWRRTAGSARPGGASVSRRTLPTTSEPERSTAMTLRPGPAGVWFVGRGSEESAIPARRGLEHLHALLTRPGTEVAALRLAGGAETVEQAGLGEVVDAQALTAYRRRLAEIDTELDEADASGDAERGATLTTERDALLAEVSAATGLGGRLRTSGSGAERARVTVRKAIATALDTIHSADPVVARHLTMHVRTGSAVQLPARPGRPGRVAALNCGRRLVRADRGRTCHGSPRACAGGTPCATREGAGCG